MLGLLVSEAILTALVAFGPAVDDVNRLVGTLTLVLSIALTLIVGCAAPERRFRLIQFLVVGLALGSFAVFSVIGYEPRGFSGAHAYPRILELPSVIGVPIGTNGLAAVALPAVLGAAVFAMHAGRFWRRLLWVALGLAPTSVIIVGSRDGTVGLLAGLVVLMVTWRLTGWSRVALAMFVGSMAALAAIAAFSRDGSFTSRLSLWAGALDYTSRYPLAWAPFGSFARLLPLLKTHGPILTVHNTLLQVFVDLGPIGFVATIAAVVNSLLAAGRVGAGGGRRERQLLTTGFLAVLAAVLIEGGAESALVSAIRFEGKEYFLNGVLQIEGTTVAFVSPILLVLLALPLKQLRLPGFGGRAIVPRRPPNQAL